MRTHSQERFDKMARVVAIDAVEDAITLDRADIAVAAGQPFRQRQHRLHAVRRAGQLRMAHPEHRDPKVLGQVRAMEHVGGKGAGATASGPYRGRYDCARRPPDKTAEARSPAARSCSAGTGRPVRCGPATSSRFVPPAGRRCDRADGPGSVRRRLRRTSSHCCGPRCAVRRPAWRVPRHQRHAELDRGAAFTDERRRDTRCACSAAIPQAGSSTSLAPCENLMA